MKIGSRFFFGRVRGPFACQPKALLLPFERASIGASGPEGRSSIADGALGCLQLLLRAAFFGFEREQPQTLANAMKLGSCEILNALEPRFEANPLGVSFAPRPGRGPASLVARGNERRRLSSRSAFGLAEGARARIDLLPPERHERLEGVALLQRSFLSAVTRG
jgi:hypothetical protein